MNQPLRYLKTQIPHLFENLVTVRYLQYECGSKSVPKVKAVRMDTWERGSQSYLFGQRIRLVNRSLKKARRLVLLKPPIPFDSTRTHGLPQILPSALVYLIMR